MPENELDQLLMRRNAPQAAPHLAERIITQAQAKPKYTNAAWPLSKYWRDVKVVFTDIFILPQPAFVVAFALFVGVSFGINTGFPDGDADNMQVISSFMNVEDNFNIGEWL